MKIPFPHIVLALVLLAILGPGMPVYAGDGSLIGAGIGGVAGGIIGSGFGRGPSRTLAMAAGIGIGATMGSTIGGQADRHPLYVTSADTRPGLSNDTTSLVFTKASPNYVAPPAPPPTYIDQHAQTYCRQYSQEVNDRGKAREAYGTVCLQPDGTWRSQ